jgi:hypothetical protein
MATSAYGVHRMELISTYIRVCIYAYYNMYTLLRAMTACA